MLIISVIVAVSIGVTKAKLDNIVTYTYYSGYGTLKSVARQMIANYNEQDETYTSTLPIYVSEAQKKEQSNGFVKFFRNMKYSIFQPAYAINCSQYSCSAVCNSYNKAYNASICSQCCSGSGEAQLGCNIKSCPDGQMLMKYLDGTCECKGGAVEIGPPVTIRCSGEQPCGKICLAGRWVVDPNFDKTCAANFTWDDTTCGCVCNKTCTGNFTLNKNTCSCECNKTCSSGFTLNKNTCACECNKTCSSGFTLNKNTCSCECNKTCSSGYTLDKNTCTCKQTYFECSGTAPCGKECDHSTGKWVDISGFNKTCSGNFTWSDSSCGCVCNKACSTGYKLNTNTCSCVCNKTCPTGFTLNKNTCSCECRNVCKLGYTLNKDTCTCEQTYFECSGTAPCGKECDHSTGKWVDISGFDKTCPSNFTWSNSSCGCVCNKACFTGYKLNTNTCSCECNKTCPTGFTLNKSTCSCECRNLCKFGYTLNKDTCTCEKTYFECPSFSSVNYCGLMCDHSTGNWVADPSVDKTCQSGYEWDNSSCSCKQTYFECSGSAPCGKECDHSTGKWVNKSGFSRTCPTNYTWDENSCGCKQTYFECSGSAPCGKECDHSTGKWVDKSGFSKTCSGNFTWSDTSCGCVCNKTCSTGYKLNKNTCSCECNKTCASGYTLDKNSCTCKQTTFECTGSQPCGKKCDTSTGNWVNDPSFSRSCASGEWDEEQCRCVTSQGGAQDTPKTCIGSKPCGAMCDTTTGSWVSDPSFSRSCKSGYKWDESSCSCKKATHTCTRYSSVNYCGLKCDTSTGDWVKDTSVTKQCSSGSRWNDTSCSCEKIPTYSCSGSQPCGKKCDIYTGNWVTDTSVNKTCSSAYEEWDDTKCACVQTYFECAGSKPCGMKCDHSSGHWVADSSVNKTCSSGYKWSEAACSCVEEPQSLPPEDPVAPVTSTECSGTRPSCCHECDTTTGNWVQKSDCPPVCGIDKQWSDTQCACVPRPRTVPVSGYNFCEKFVSYTNTSPSLISTAECHGSTVNNNTNDFSDLNPDFILRNGIRFYNVHTDPQPIPALVNNKPGFQYKSPSGVMYEANSTGFTVYVDIDGKSGDSQLWVDVFPFYVTMSGLVIPAYDMANGSEISGGNSSKHLQASVRLDKIANGRRTHKWLAKSVSFKEAACMSGFVSSNTPYCAGVNFNNECSAQNAHCSVKTVYPLKFF